MKKSKQLSIQTQLLLSFLGFIVLTVGLLWAFQVFLFGNLYMEFKTSETNLTCSKIVNITDNTSFTMEQNSSGTVVRITPSETWKQNAISICNANMSSCAIVLVDDNNIAQQWTYSGAMPSNIFQNNVPGELASLISNTETDSHSVVRLKGVPTAISVHLLSYGNTTIAIVANSTIQAQGTTVKTIEMILIIVSLIVGIVAIASSQILAGKFSRPIKAINDRAKTLSQGEYATTDKIPYIEIAELDKSLAEASREIKRTDDLQTELITNISHDLKTPLTLIGGYAEMLRDHPEMATEERMSVISDETTHLTALVDDILDLSRIKSGTMKYNNEDICITDEIDSVIERFNMLKEKEGYTISHIYTTSSHVCTDSMRFSQIIYNLLINALNYTGADKSVCVSEEIQGDKVHISISDTGTGIEPQDLADIWNRYKRGSDTHHRAVKGSGLGLNIVREIFEHYSYTYGVDSTEQGCTFYFDIPLIDNAK